jgi:hypothetical protein
VRRFGGVLEHPASSLAWKAYGLLRPPRRGWARALDGSWVCAVAQSAYGCLAMKMTWLVLYGGEPLPCDWRRPKGSHVVGYMTNHGCVGRPRISKALASRTPPAFAEFLVELARRCKPDPVG